MRAFDGLKASSRLIQRVRKVAGLVERADFKPELVYLRSRWTNLRSDRADLRPERAD